jgi:hypothetical protein
MKAWKLLVAFFRWDEKIVCEMSKGRGLTDFHDYPDSLTPEPWHFQQHICKRCGKSFSI